MMKALISTLFCVGLLFGTAFASPETEAQYESPPSSPPDELEQLVAPVALYPDPLVALILPASTESTDIVLAARYLDKGGTPDDIEVFPWADSVKGLAHYPELTRWLNENLSWTRQLGDAYATQPAEVMAAIQRTRARARANGTLASTSQQQVIVTDGHILIVPAQPNVIYVPRYDPEIIYYTPTIGYPTRSWITFGTGFGVGWWLSYSCDWRLRSIWFDDLRRDHWRQHRDWRQHYIPHRKTKHPPTGWRQWKPKSGRPRHYTPPGTHPHGKVARPTPWPHTPRYDRSHSRPSSRNEREDRRPVHQTVTHPIFPRNSTTTARPPSPPTVASPSSTTPTHHRRISSPTTTRKHPQPHVRKQDHLPKSNVTRHPPTTSSRPTTRAAPSSPPVKRIARPPSHSTPPTRHAKPLIRSEKKDLDKDKHTDR